MELFAALVLFGLPLAFVAFLVFAVTSVETQSRIRQVTHALTRSLTGRLVLLGITGVVLLVPLGLVDGLRQEREYRLSSVRHQIGEQWGTEQWVLGPMLHLPVLEHSEETIERKGPDGPEVTIRPVVERREYLWMPEQLEVNGELDTRSLSRGMYDVLVYESGISLQASFKRPQIPARPGVTVEPLWDQAELLVGLSDLSAVAGVEEFTWQGAPVHANSGRVPGVERQSGIRAAIGNFDGETAEVAVRLNLRGMEQLMVGAMAEQTEIELSGAWGSPSFTGFTLPAERQIDGDRFVGIWSVPGVARPIPQRVEVGAEENYSLGQAFSHGVGVRLVEPASAYASVERAITYGMLVIALCLLTFLMVEHGLNLQLHPIQWLVNGFAMVVFYLVLLATSEHRGFHVGYLVASAVTLGLMTTYVGVATRRVAAAGTIGASLTVLYGAMYWMLRSEDNALILGTSLVVIALASLMWMTRHLASSMATPASMPQPQPTS